MVCTRVNFTVTFTFNFTPFHPRSLLTPFYTFRNQERLFRSLELPVWFQQQRRAILCEIRGKF